MTPLAQRILRRCIGDKKDRFSSYWKEEQPDLVDHLKKAQFFDVTAVEDAAWRLKESSSSQNIASMTDCLFLPAKLTWMEGVFQNQRCAYFLAEHPNEKNALVFVFFDHTAFPIGLIGLKEESGWFDVFSREQLMEMQVPGFSSDVSSNLFESVAENTLLHVAVLLAMINTPRIIGRKQHMPHRGLEKRLLSRRKAIGHFPLNGWTEIKLEVTPNPKDLSDGEPQEAHLTGERALHYCRAHLRLKAGKIEYVRGHWRGDASLGIKRSRYILKDSALKLRETV